MGGELGRHNVRWALCAGPTSSPSDCCLWCLDTAKAINQCSCLSSLKLCCDFPHLPRQFLSARPVVTSLGENFLPVVTGSPPPLQKQKQNPTQQKTTKTKTYIHMQASPSDRICGLGLVCAFSELSLIKRKGRVGFCSLRMTLSLCFLMY